MLFIAIDGACRRNGKPDCVAAGGVFINNLDVDNSYESLSAYEYNSTNQRGELLALLRALEYAATAKQETYIVTDSEYLFNAVTKSWYDRWMHNNWKTASGDAVKNKDIWHEISQVLQRCDNVNVYHIKGHVIPFGKVTADTLLQQDPTGGLLYKEVAKKYDVIVPTRALIIENTQELSIKNNGFRLNDEFLKLCVVSNIVADALATRVVNLADRES